MPFYTRLHIGPFYWRSHSAGTPRTVRTKALLMTSAEINAVRQAWRQTGQTWQQFLDMPARSKQQWIADHTPAGHPVIGTLRTVTRRR